MLLGATVVSARAQSCWRLRKAATPAANAEQCEICLGRLEAECGCLGEERYLNLRSRSKYQDLSLRGQQLEYLSRRNIRALKAQRKSVM